MPEPIVANANPAGEQPANPGNIPPVGPQATEPNVPPVETPSPEPTYTIKYKGQEEKLPISKVLDFAQQGRDYSEKMGKLNAEIETRAQELANATLEQLYREQEEAANRAKPPIDPNNPEPVDDFTSLQKTVEELKAEREKEVFEKEVDKNVKELNAKLTQAAEKYPLANQTNILAVLRSQPDADVMKLAEYEHNREKTRRDDYEKAFLAKAGERGKRGVEAAGGVPVVPAGKKIGWNNTQEAVKELLEKQN